MATQPMCSAVIPVFNSSEIISETIDRTVSFFEQSENSYEIILVNDGSSDDTWQILKQKVAANPNLVAIDFVRNYGQHNAVYCGLEQSTGEYIITMDDDLQNPPEEITHLMEMATKGHDFVVGRYPNKKHPLYRRLGSEFFSFVNQKIFGQSKDVSIGNFRLLRRDLVERICSYRTSTPYITGLAMLLAANPASVTVDHKERKAGKSQYSFLRILTLSALILFNYSSYPLRMACTFGFVVSLMSLLIGLYYLVHGLVVGSAVPGWTTLVVLISFHNGFLMMVIGMLGEYLNRLLNQTVSQAPYYIRETVRAKS